MNQFLRGADRGFIVNLTALYLVVYAVINACGGVGLTLLGGFAGSGFTGILDRDADAIASATLETMGGLVIVLGLLYLVSVPFFAAAAWGLWQRKAWARQGAVIALAFSLVLSLLNLGSSPEGFVWVLVSAFGIYFYSKDLEIRELLSR
jgi:uncharacterized membrane protein (DUF2068 family)